MDRPVLFVAREPDETLRTYLPIIDELARRGITSRVIFHYPPGDSVCTELQRREVPWWRVSVPERRLPRLLARLPASLAEPLAEVAQLRATRALAYQIVEREHPSAVVVIQDTLLLERFMVRWANRRGIPTLVIQWAFNFRQEYYDRLRAIKQPQRAAPRRSLGLYGRLQRLLDIKFNLISSTGGGEARRFAVMGAHFAEQFREQGVVGKPIIVTGHPLHDAAYERVQAMQPADLERIRAAHLIPPGERVVLYATQPFFWRGVISPEELRQNIDAMNTAVSSLGPAYRLTVKLHPRESAADYAFCAELSPPVRVIPTADMTDLIAAADVFVSSSSSTVLLAMMLDRPIVTVNFNQVLHFDVFEPIGGTLHCRTHDEFARALERIVNDSAARATLAEQRHAALDRLARFDGRATSRIADLLCET